MMQGKIVAAVSYEGSVYIFTEHGYVYEMCRDHNNLMVFRLVHRMIEQ